MFREGRLLIHLAYYLFYISDYSMINFRYLIIIFVLIFSLSDDIYFSISLSLFISVLIRFITISNFSLAFREFVLLLYLINYLVSPSISFLLGEKITAYNLKLSPEAYFNLAIPGIVFFYLGLFSINTNLFSPNFSAISIATIINEKLLKKVTILAILSSLLTPFLPGDLAFVVYLISLLQYVSSFSLFALNPKKNKVWPAITLLFVLYKSFLAGMYHDAVMWVLFFGVIFIYIIKPTLKVKIAYIFFSIIFILFIQSIKKSYREEVWYGQKSASIATASEVGYSKANTDIILGEENLLGSLNRSNQAWIFSSTVDNLDRNKNFQGLTVVYKYLEASLLPRFLAPDKIKSGDKEIFNTFSGHTINAGTSMGLGIFADGYVAYGAIGVYIFGFVLGLIFALTFKLVEGWTKISPFYVLLIFPLLNYAVRPDCELQTTINHLSKGIMLYGLIVWYTKKRFSFAIENPAP
jgi:hypothetical protein